jgi:hypothetical protein
MEVTPVNTIERVFTVLVLLFALVTFSSFVSSITSAMTELRNLNSERLEQRAVLRRYLRENRISAVLTSRIWGWLESTLPSRPRRPLRKEAVRLLAALPQALQSELQDQIFRPVLENHPFFRFFNAARSAEMRFVYPCLGEVPLDNGQELFAEGQPGRYMYFVLSGVLNYYTEQWVADTWEPRMESESLTVEGGQWLSEPSLWVHWKHAGQLTAVEDASLVSLESERLQQVMSCELQDVWEPGKYARLFMRYVEHNDICLTDYWKDPFILYELSSSAFGDIPELNLPKTALRRTSLRGDPGPRLSSRRPSLNSILTASSRFSDMSQDQPWGGSRRNSSSSSLSSLFNSEDPQDLQFSRRSSLASGADSAAAASSEPSSQSRASRRSSVASLPMLMGAGIQGQVSAASCGLRPSWTSLSTSNTVAGNRRPSTTSILTIATSSSSVTSVGNETGEAAAGAGLAQEVPQRPSVVSASGDTQEMSRRFSIASAAEGESGADTEDSI